MSFRIDVFVVHSMILFYLFLYMYNIFPTPESWTKKKSQVSTPNVPFLPQKREIERERKKNGFRYKSTTILHTRQYIKLRYYC